MKKSVVLMAAVLLTAVSVQASSLTWGSTSTYGLYDSAGTIIPKGNTTVTLVLALLPSAGYDVATATLTAFESSIKSTATVSTKNNGQVTGSLTGISSSGAVYEMYAKIGTSYYKVLDMTTSTMVANYTVTGVTSGTETIANYQPGSTTAYSLPAHNLKINGTALTFVPEPTSMALLAIGAAALGMRRKFRK